MRKSYTLLPILLFPFLTLSANNNDDFIIEDEVNIYPIPAKKHFTIEVPFEYAEGTIIITNMVGKEIMLIQLFNETKVKILTTELPKGIYFISIQVKSEMVFTKRIVIDK